MQEQRRNPSNLCQKTKTARNLSQFRTLACMLPAVYPCTRSTAFTAWKEATNLVDRGNVEPRAPPLRCEFAVTANAPL